MWFSIEVPFCGVFETTTTAMRFPLMLKGDTKTWPNEPLIELPLFPSSSAEFEQTVRTKNDGISMFSINPESFAPRKKCIPTLPHGWKMTYNVAFDFFIIACSTLDLFCDFPTPCLLSLLPAPNEYQFFAIAFSSREQQKKEQQYRRPAGYYSRVSMKRT